eukprot:CAMPEP_0113452694 /NCGR_PEP_ID=MMETSP0014_2-20120614/6977_1 /TAXON_ID=2857 /ORGANISM="Nitzschia sp." /LENGTH=481 /DNA_ID=CAMNT_0000344071 /DNA_START=435 /DNA_END=1880 /DNA_ORIENTATION=+ /assembly_acc=CAM_ASM_000159
MSSSSSITVERAIEFNNAGVQVAAAGYPRVAWELFKGALEVKLAVERYVAAAPPPASAAVGPSSSSPPSQSDTTGIAVATSTDATITVVQDNLQHPGESKCPQHDHHQRHHHPGGEGEAGPPPPPYPSNVFIEQAECHMDRIERYTLNPIPWHHRSSLPPVTIPVRIGNGGTSTGNGNEDVMMDDAVEVTADTVSPSGTTSTHGITVSPPDSPGFAIEVERGTTAAAAAAATTTTTVATPAVDMRPQYTPRLLMKPLLLEAPSDDLLVQAVRSGMESATIIFNLALLDHLNYTGSEQAIALYELAMSLVRTGSVSNNEFFVDPLSISLLNNLAVWSYENGDIDGAQACMFKLVSILQQHHQIQVQVQMQMQQMQHQHSDDGSVPAQGRAAYYWNGRSVSVVSSEDGVNDDYSNNDNANIQAGLSAGAETSPRQLHNNNNSNNTNNSVMVQMIQLFEPSEQATLESNIVWFMDPFYEVSPAA